MTGSMPPAARPLMKHMPIFQARLGIAPQIDVPTITTADSRIEALRPLMSAMTPYRNEPATVPISAKNGTRLTVASDTPYSTTIPGAVKPSEASFITSITSAMTRTNISRQCC